MRSFDRRGGKPLPSAITRACWPQIDWAGVDAKRKEDDLSLGLDCMCENNDPECKECWLDPQALALAAEAEGICYEGPYIGDVARSGPVGVATSGTNGAITLSPTAPVLSEFERDVRNRFDECLELLLREHADYGPANIANAPGGPLNGLRVRMHDKLARINHLIDTGALPENESLRDSLVDLCNYSLIGLMVIDERWPTE